MVAAFVGVVLAAAASATVHAQQTFEFFLWALDAKGVPILDLQAARADVPDAKGDVSVKEESGEAHVVSVQRFGWPLKVTILLDNGQKTRDMGQHVRAGLEKFVEGIPGDVPLSLITTAPAPRFLVRDSKDPVQIKTAIGRITPEAEDGGAFGRFSDSLIEYANRLDDEFRSVGPEQLPPYLPVLIVISTTTQDGSAVRKEDNIKMIRSLVKHKVWTNFVMVTPSKTATVTDLASQPTVEPDEAQVAEIAIATQEATKGKYFPLSGSGVSGLSTTVLPNLAQEVALRYIKQMTQHRVVVERPAGAKGPIKAFGVAVNRPDVKFIYAFTPYIP
jgi:hypothetical protein